MSKVDTSALSPVEPAPQSSGGSADVLRLNVGAGGVPLPGYTPIDRKNGQEAYPLDYPDESVDEVRASHVLEHFSHRQTLDVLRDWARVLKPGGVLKIAVPNFDWICEQYLAGTAMPTEAYVMGGHCDSDDVHGALFERHTLTQMLHEVGIRRVETWQSDIEDCASLQVSLNLCGVKQAPTPIGSIMAVMSTPRLGFMDNFFSAYQALMPLGIHFRKYTGAFWDQCLQRVIEQSLNEDNADAILTIDYDSIFDIQDVQELIRLSEEYPEADAICGLQSSRATNLPLMTMLDDDGKPVSQVERSVFAAPLTKIHTGHFGLTLIRRHVFDRMEQPWFWSKPDPDTGSWATDAAKVDADIYFWQRLNELGMSLYMANRVVVGHGEFMVRWPGRDFQVMYQHPNDYFADGKPKDAWR